MSTVIPHQSFLATRRGKLMLALLCSVAFLDFVDAPIVNVALPSIRHALHFSVPSLQWVPSGYLLTYGGFMLLGGRAADLIGRRRVLIAGILVIGLSSLIGGFAQSSAVLIGARLAQGLGAAMTLPSALSILTTRFKEGKDRNTALGVWGGVGGLASAVGVLLGGFLTEGLGWRWVMFVNPIACAFVLVGVFRLIGPDPRRSRPGLRTCLCASRSSCRLHLLPAPVPSRHEGGDRRRVADRGRRDLLALTDPGRRLVCQRPPARDGDHVARLRTCVRRRDHG